MKQTGKLLTQGITEGTTHYLLKMPLRDMNCTGDQIYALHRTGHYVTISTRVDYISQIETSKT
jgi:hypothetical protein